MQTLFFYVLFVLPAVMSLIALAFAWNSVAGRALFGTIGFLSLVGLQSIVRWATLISLNNFTAVSGIAAGSRGEGPPLSFLFRYYGTEFVLVVVLGILLLRWLGGALASR
jgi:hypothetical protein